MKKKVDVEKALHIIAMQEGVTVEEVRKQIKLAMLSGMRSQDPVVQARWERIPCKGELPMPEELITYIATQVDAGIDLP